MKATEGDADITVEPEGRAGEGNITTFGETGILFVIAIMGDDTTFLAMGEDSELFTLLERDGGGVDGGGGLMAGIAGETATFGFIVLIT